MSRDLSLLEGEFRPQVETLLTRLKGEGVEMRPFFTTRTPWEQARLWRQSRTRREIDDHLDLLKAMGAPFLAMALADVGPQYGAHVTNALPGQSWHNWGLAVDCFLVNADGTANWDKNAIGYATYATMAIDMGLQAGLFWPMRDAVHVQRPRDSSPPLSWGDIDRAMKERFG